MISYCHFRETYPIFWIQCGFSNRFFQSISCYKINSKCPYNSSWPWTILLIGKKSLIQDTTHNLNNYKNWLPLHRWIDFTNFSNSSFANLIDETWVRSSRKYQLRKFCLDSSYSFLLHKTLLGHDCDSLTWEWFMNWFIWVHFQVSLRDFD